MQLYVCATATHAHVKAGGAAHQAGPCGWSWGSGGSRSHGCECCPEARTPPACSTRACLWLPATDACCRGLPTPQYSSPPKQFATPQLSRIAQRSMWHASRWYHRHTYHKAPQANPTGTTRARHLLHVHIHLVVLGQVLLVDERMRVDLVRAAAVADVGHQRNHWRGIRRTLQAPCSAMSGPRS